ncbi:MAG: peptidase S41 [bacterium]|nr:peptidase S41 [bacterium]
MPKLFKQVTTVLVVLFISLFIPSCSGGPKPDETANRVGNIQTFARLYGYVKYFYPGDEASTINWEHFAIYGARQVEKAKNQAELKAVLEELFHPITPALEIYKTSEKKTFSTASITPPDTGKMKVVTWQHLGVNVNQGPIYKSIRLNREYEIVESRGLANMSTSIDATPYRGKEIKFKAAVKVEKGEGRLWLRVGLPNQKRGFYDYMSDRLIKPSNWNYYEIIGTVDDDALKISFGGRLGYVGKLWVDDFQLYVREKNTAEWERVTIDNPDFENDEEDKVPEKWKLAANYHLYRVTGSEAATGNKSIEIRSKPGKPVGPEGLFPQKAEFGEHIVKELGAGLSCIMPIALYGTETQTFPKAPEAQLETLKAAIQTGTPKKYSGDDLYVRLGGMVIGWNILRHFFPYADISKIDWNSELTKGLTRAYKDKTSQDFLKTIRKLAAALKDGHGWVFMAGYLKTTALAPINWDWVEDQLVVTQVYDKSITALHVGDLVTAIDGIPVKEAVERERQYISAATEGWLRSRLMVELRRGVRGSVMKLKVNRNNKPVETEISIPRSISIMEHYANREPTIKSKIIEEGIYYLNLDRISMKEINDLMPELVKARAIIFDLRGYPNRNHELIPHLLKEKDTSDAWMRIPQVIYPDYQKVTYLNDGWLVEPEEPYLTAKRVFITGGSALSYSESYMGIIDHYSLATIVGQPTGGTNGNTNPFRLPGGIDVSWTAMRVVRHDGSQHHGVGIKPHILVERTIKGIQEGRDEFLEKAIEIAKQSN